MVAARATVVRRFLLLLLSPMSRAITIIGAGVIGTCTAYYAAKRGLRVRVLDRDPASEEGCSFGNAGMVVPSHFIPLAAPGMVALGLKWMWNPESPFYIKPRLDFDLLGWAWKFMRAATPAHVNRCAPLIRDLSFASRAAFAELAQTLDFDFTERGLLMLCKTPHALDEEAKTAARASELGVPAQVLDARATAAHDPGVAMDVAGSVYFPKDCHLSPNRFMAAMRAECEKLGVVFQYNTEVTGWRSEGRRIAAIQTSAGEITSDEFVLCGGSWSPGVARDLRVALPMQAGKGYSVTLREPRQLPRLCAIFAEARVAVTPMGSTLRFGGTMEIAGLNLRVNPRRVQGIIKAVPKYYPEFRVEDFAQIEPWRGLRPCSPDGMPYLGRLAAYDNLSTATAHAMMGLSLGPITGQIMADILTGEKPSHDLTLLNPDRYA
jgi:D-amino-acid dehydrogenase